MNATRMNLGQAFDQLRRLHEALAALRDEVYPRDPRLFALMAEGPLAQIREIQQQIDSESGAGLAGDLEAEVWMKAEGSRVSWPEAKSSVLTSLLDALRKGLQNVATHLSGLGEGAGRRLDVIKHAADLEVVSLRPGSLIVGLRLPLVEDPPLNLAGQPLMPNALHDYFAAAAWAASERPAEELGREFTDDAYRRLVLSELRRLTPRQTGAVEVLSLFGRLVGGQMPIQLSRASRGRIDAAVRPEPALEPEEHLGVLREVDLDKGGFILRKPETVEEVRCSFDEDLHETVKEALDRWVRVQGLRRRERARGPATVLGVFGLEILESDPRI